MAPVSLQKPVRLFVVSIAGVSTMEQQPRREDAAAARQRALAACSPPSMVEQLQRGRRCARGPSQETPAGASGYCVACFTSGPQQRFHQRRHCCRRQRSSSRGVGGGAYLPLANPMVDLDQGWAVIWPEGSHWVGLVVGNPETVTKGNRLETGQGWSSCSSGSGSSGSGSSGSGSAGSSASIETFGKTPEV